MVHRNKIFGFFFGRRLKFSIHTQFLSTKITKTRCMFYVVLNRKIPLLIKTKINTHKMYIRPITTYSGESWGSQLAKTNWSKLENIQNTNLRTITNSLCFVSNQTILNSARLPTIKNFIYKQTKTMFYKYTFSEYSHVHQLDHTASNFTTKKKTRLYD